MVYTYLKQRFPVDVREFFFSLYRGPRHRNTGDDIVRDPQYYFHCHDLAAEPTDHLVHVQQPAYFAVSMTYIVLVNQMFHCHFPEQFARFFSHTQYPNVAGGLNPSASPYHVLRKVRWEKRGVSSSQLELYWGELMEHFQEDIHEYLSGTGAKLRMDWNDVFMAIQSDPDIWGPRPYGPILRAKLGF